MRTLALLLVGLLLCNQAAFGETWRTDFNKRSIELSEILSGGPPKDGIPAIDKPKFIPAKQAKSWLHDKEPVIAIIINGEARAYPLQILIWHEIVNDTVQNVPISVTFCPLCNASLVFKRQLGDRVLDFGTTGRLRNSDMVMYDRQTETWWQQFTGEAIVGELLGSKLNELPAQIISYAEFVRVYPDAKLLSNDTGYNRDYGRNPYRGYDRVGNSPFLLDAPTDPRLPAMQRVLAVSHAGQNKLYPFSALNGSNIFEEHFNGMDLVIFTHQNTLSVLDSEQIKNSRNIISANAFNRKVNNQTLSFRSAGGGIEDIQTKSSWNLLGVAVSGPLAGQRLQPLPGGVHFAFAWLAFKPDSVIYNVER